ncbi:PTS sugar transporter subunit IIA [Halobacillus naozhouensis]|uniref:PTS glucose transporter subunit IIA n=1 Tax=Halobacillus naozhouensis TaxID=554880 RepID=A0ABY8IUU1_9BACI|nr:PTS glucose transporter subunit IIA [Halobacillus naozhouensis]WFT73567.1 PTS glucose transporter subunit IIA [Halobacillus naozhouensis]
MTQNKIMISSPFSGKIIQLSDVPKQKFSNKMMGEGIAIEPTEGEMVAPVSGEVTQIFPTKDAVNLLTDTGVELLLQVGIDAEELEGVGFETNIKEKSRVSRGDSLITFDLAKVTRELSSLASPIVIMNRNQVAQFSYTSQSNVIKGETIIMELELTE